MLVGVPRGSLGRRGCWERESWGSGMDGAWSFGVCRMRIGWMLLGRLVCFVSLVWFWEAGSLTSRRPFIVVGIMRCAAYSSSVNRYVHPPFHPLLHHTLTPPHRPLHTPATSALHKDSSIQHFYDKLLHIREQLKTEAGRRMAERRHQFVSTLFNPLLCVIWGGVGVWGVR